MTYRELQEAKAARLREWAAKREARAAAVFQAGERFHGDHAFNTQPGHIPERARLIAREDRAHESLRVADRIESRAAHIEAAADHAIYSDDPNAVQALEARIAGLEAERERIKAYNASCRKGARDLSLLTEEDKRTLAGCLQFQPYACKDGQFPSYHLAGITSNIAKQRERLRVLSGVPDTALRCYACRRKITRSKTCIACGEPVSLCGYCAYKPAATICEKHF